MANVYVRSGAAGSGTGADWTNAYTTLAAAYAAKAAGDSFWVSEDHAQTQGSAMTLTSPGSASNPCFVRCVDHTGTVPPVSADLRTTATITTTGAFGITIAGAAYYRGITFNAGSGAVSNVLLLNGTWMTFELCALRKLGTTGTSTAINFGGQKTRFINTTMQFGATSDGIRPGGLMIWENTAAAITGSVFPTTFIQHANACTVILRGVDLSPLGTSAAIVAPGSAAAQTYLDACKLPASATFSAPTSTTGATYVVRCDSGATNYRNEVYRYEGTQTVETTIVRTGGASDGTTPIAWKIVTAADSKFVIPYESEPIAIWNETTGSSITVTVYGIWGGGAVPNNDDIWIDVEYLGSSATPLGSFANSTKANDIATASAITSDGSTWGGSTTAFKMSATFTPQMKGPINIIVRAAKASSTFYIDPKAAVS